MIDINKVILVGRLGTEPELKETRNGNAYARFSVATNGRPYKTENGEVRQETQWHRIVTWGNQAKNCAQYLKKGTAVYLEGEIRSHRYQDRDGTEQIAFEIHADQVSFLSRKEELPVL